MITLKVPYVRKIAMLSYVKVSSGFSKVNATGNTIVFMYEPRFRKLAQELENKGFNIIFLGRGIFDYIFRIYLNEYIKNNKRTFSEYALDVYEKYKRERKLYLEESTYIAKLLKEYLSSSTIILPKYNDDYTLELVQSFHDSGWVTIVYDREGTVTKRRLDHIPQIISRQASTCDYILTYNETHKNFFEKVFSLSSINSPEIIVMGNPASDEWFHDTGFDISNTKKQKSGEKKILFFAFGEFSYVYDTEYLRGKNEVWRSLLQDIHDVFTDYLTENPKHCLWYKRGPKGNRDYWPGSEKLLGIANACLIPSNANSNQLIKDCDVVVAFQTTALIDAMHTDKVIIYCAWGDIYEELKNDLIDFEAYAQAGAILHARTPDEFKYLLSLDHSNYIVNYSARKQIRELFTTNPDGNVAKRFAEWIVDTFPSTN